MNGDSSVRHRLSATHAKSALFTILAIFLIAAVANPALGAPSWPQSEAIRPNSASGWNSASSALTDNTQAATTTDDEDDLVISGFTSSDTGTIQSVTLKIRAEDPTDENSDMDVVVTASGCGGVQYSPSSVQLNDLTTLSFTLTCPNGWTWASIDSISVTLTTHTSGGLLGLGETGSWRVEHVWLETQFTNQAPTGEAGSNQVVDEGDAVQLHGTASDPEDDDLSYAWTQTGGPTVGGTNSGAFWTFTAAEVDSGSIDLDFELEVTDAYGNVDTDSVSITVLDEAAPPPAQPPSEPAPEEEEETEPPAQGDPSDPENPASGDPEGPGAEDGTGTGAGDGSDDSTTGSPGTTPGVSVPWQFGSGENSEIWLLLIGAVGFVAVVGGATGGLLVRRRTKARREAFESLFALRREEEADPPSAEDLEQELKNEELLQFLNNASHDLASPLTPIRLQLHMLTQMDTEGMDDKQRRALEVVSRNVEQMGLLVQDLKEASRLQAGKMELFPEPIDLHQVAKDAVDSFRDPAEEQEVTLKLNDAAKKLPINGDSGRLNQVVYNLLTNAIKFTPKGGTVTVHTQLEGNHAVIRVQDTGIGLTQEAIDQLFKPFSQVHGAEERKKGSGLGLYISQGIVEGHDGEIWIESDGPGTGSQFCFKIPVR